MSLNLCILQLFLVAKTVRGVLEAQRALMCTQLESVLLWRKTWLFSAVLANLLEQSREREEGASESWWA